MTSTNQVIKALKISDINIDEILVGTKKINKTVPITLGEKSLIFQTPFIEVTGNLRQTHYPNIYQLDTLFRGDTKQRIQNWYHFIENFETHVSNQVINNDPQWFTQKNVVFKSLIRELDSEKGIFFIKWAIDLKLNIFVDENKNPVNPTNLKDKDLIKLIVEISDLWIHENQCGLAIVVQKILVKPYIEKIYSEYVFDETDSENSFDKDSNIISLLATDHQTRPVSNKNNSQESKKINNQSKIVMPTSYGSGEKQISPMTKRESPFVKIKSNDFYKPQTKKKIY